MRVEITDMETAAPRLVRFRCAAGEGAATWCGSEPPVIGHSYTVELDHDLPLCRVVDGSLTDGSNSICRLGATVEDIDENLILTLTIGSGVMLAQLGPGETPPPRDTEIELVD